MEGDHTIGRICGRRIIITLMDDSGVPSWIKTSTSRHSSELLCATRRCTSQLRAHPPSSSSSPFFWEAYLLIEGALNGNRPS